MAVSVEVGKFTEGMILGNGIGGSTPDIIQQLSEMFEHTGAPTKVEERRRRYVRVPLLGRHMPLYGLTRHDQYRYDIAIPEVGVTVTGADNESTEIGYKALTPGGWAVKAYLSVLLSNTYQRPTGVYVPFSTTETPTIGEYHGDLPVTAGRFAGVYIDMPPTDSTDGIFRGCVGAYAEDVPHSVAAAARTLEMFIPGADEREIATRVAESCGQANVGELRQLWDRAMQLDPVGAGRMVLSAAEDRM